MGRAGPAHTGYLVSNYARPLPYMPAGEYELRVELNITLAPAGWNLTIPQPSALFRNSPASHFRIFKPSMDRLGGSFLHLEESKLKMLCRNVWGVLGRS